MPKTDNLAICSLVLGILAFLGLGPLGGIPAIICGHVSRNSIKKSEGKLSGEGMALAGIILGYTILGLTILAVPVIFTFQKL